MFKVFEPYNQGTTETDLEHPLTILRRFDEFGLRETGIRLVENLNERGVRAAGTRFLPLTWLGLLLGIIGVATAIHLLNGIIAALVGPTSRTFHYTFFFFWVMSPIVIFWDCIAAERYLKQNWEAAKLNAILAIFIGPAALIFQSLYRIKKM